MQKYQDCVVAYIGGAMIPVALANVEVTVAATGIIADTFSDNGLTPSGTIVTDANGSFSFYAADGRYNLTITSQAIETITRNDILLEDPSSLPDKYLAIDGTAVAANALNAANNYTVGNQISFNNGGTGSGYIASANATWGMIHRPSVDGSSASHLFTNAAGALVASITSAGNAAFQGAVNAVGSVNAGTNLSFGSNGVGTAGTIYSDANWGALITAKQTNPAVGEFRIRSADTSVNLLTIDKAANNYLATFAGAVASKPYLVAAYADLFNYSLFASWYNVATGSPNGGAYFSGFNCVLNQDPAYGWQLAGNCQGGSANELYVRKKEKDVYGAWVRILDAAYAAANTISVGALTSAGAVLADGGKRAITTNCYPQTGGVGAFISGYAVSGTIAPGTTVGGIAIGVIGGGNAGAGTWINCAAITATTTQGSTFQRIA